MLLGIGFIKGLIKKEKQLSYWPHPFFFFHPVLQVATLTKNLSLKSPLFPMQPQQTINQGTCDLAG